MKKNHIILLCIVFALTLSLANTYGQDSILYIRQDPSTGTYASDGQFADSLTSWGYQVGFINQSDFDATAPEWSNYIGIFINEPVNSGKVAKFGPSRDNYPVPCICFEGWAPKVANWGWLGDDATDLKTNTAGSVNELSIVIRDNSHYITNIFNVGDVINWSNNTGSDTSSITIGSIKEVSVTYTHKLAQNLALQAETDYWGMVALDSSAQIPSRLFWWGLNQYALNGSTFDHTDYMTTDLFKILKRAADWAYLGMGESAVSVKENPIVGNFNLTIYPNPASAITTITFSTLTATNAKVTLYNVTGQLVDVLLNKISVQGTNTYNFDANLYKAGVYVVRLELDQKTAYTKLIIK
jgi:hypothetical protein